MPSLSPLSSLAGAQFSALPLVKPVVWFARAVVNWPCSRPTIVEMPRTYSPNEARLWNNQVWSHHAYELFFMNCTGTILTKSPARSTFDIGRTDSPRAHFLPNCSKNFCVNVTCISIETHPQGSASYPDLSYSTEPVLTATSLQRPLFLADCPYIDSF